jgi:hypothetical protein
MSKPELYDGDVTFQTSFNKVGFLAEAGTVTQGFRPPKGKKFVVLLLGTVEKDARDCDPVEMLNSLGFIPVKGVGDGR